MWLGAHVGIATGLAEAPAIGRRIGADAIQIFTKSPQSWGAPPLEESTADAFIAAVRREKLRATAVHHGYLANLASPKPETLARSRAAFVTELRRAERLRVDALIFHPGAHLGSGPERGVATIAASLNDAFAQVPRGTVRVLLENAAGQGTTVGSRFAELAGILERVDDRSRVGIALDTCHLFAAGFDLRTDATYGRFVDELDAELGRREVHAFHLNDAKAELGSHLDRHENIGAGHLGDAAFARVVNDRFWAGIPGYLETPLDDRGYARYEADLARLRSLERRPARPAPKRRAPARPPRGPERR